MIPRATRRDSPRAQFGARFARPSAAVCRRPPCAGRRALQQSHRARAARAHVPPEPRRRPLHARRLPRRDHRLRGSAEARTEQRQGLQEAVQGPHRTRRLHPGVRGAGGGGGGGRGGVDLFGGGVVGGAAGRVAGGGRGGVRQRCARPPPSSSAATSTSSTTSTATSSALSSGDFAMACTFFANILQARLGHAPHPSHTPPTFPISDPTSSPTFCRRQTRFRRGCG